MEYNETRNNDNPLSSFIHFISSTFLLMISGIKILL